VKYADRAQTRAGNAVKDVEKAVDSGAEAVVDAAGKLG
jgi:hypothetical protein